MYGNENKNSKIAMFNNLLIKPLQGISPEPTVFSEKIYPMY
jgi:hypothetical protein